MRSYFSIKSIKVLKFTSAENNCDPVHAPGKRISRWKIEKPKRNLNFYYCESNNRRQPKVFKLLLYNCAFLWRRWSRSRNYGIIIFHSTILLHLLHPLEPTITFVVCVCTIHTIQQLRGVELPNSAGHTSTKDIPLPFIQKV